MRKFLSSLLTIFLFVSLVAAPAARAQTSFIDRFTGSVVATIGKQPVAAATTTSITLSGSQTIDGIVVSDHTNDNTGKFPDRVLVKNQVDTTQNGIYVVNNSGIWSLAQDFSGSSGVVNGQLIYVVGGNTNIGFWTLTTVDPICVGSSPSWATGGCTASNINFSLTNIPANNVALANGKIFIGAVSNFAAAQTMSGDCTITNSGGITCTKSNGTSFGAAAFLSTPIGTSFLPIGSSTQLGILQCGSGVSCLGGTITVSGSAGTGTVNSAAGNSIAYYATTGTAVSGFASANNGVLVTGTSGIPSIGATLPAAVQGNITTLGTVAAGTSTWSGQVAVGTTTLSGAMNVTGTVTATTFSGSGASLTGIGTANLGGITGSPSSTTFLAGNGTWTSVTGTTDFQDFLSSGTWTKPSGLSSSSMVHIQGWGGGGGGQSNGDYGGGGGAYIELWIKASSLGSTETVTIGAGGGSNANGGTTTFGSWLSAPGGPAGASGATGNNTINGIFVPGFSGGDGNAPNGSAAKNSIWGGAAGGGGLSASIGTSMFGGARCTQPGGGTSNITPCNAAAGEVRVTTFP